MRLNRGHLLRVPFQLPRPVRLMGFSVPLSNSALNWAKSSYAENASGLPAFGRRVGCERIHTREGHWRSAHQGSWVGWRKVAHGSAVGRPAAGNEASEALPSLRSAPGYAASGAMIPKLSSLATPQIHSVPPLTGPLAASIGCRRWKGRLGFRSRHPARKKAGSGSRSGTQIFAMAAE